MTRLGAAALVAVCALMLGGCGGSGKEKRTDDEKMKERAERALSLRIDLGRTQQMINQLRTYQETQAKQLAAAQSQLDALQSTLDSLENRYPALRTTTATLQHVKATRAAEQSEDAAKQEAGRGVFSTILIVLFIAFVVVWFSKIWRSKPQDQFPASPDSIAAQKSEENQD